jgi:glycosyltransferase involved in cell wall biosynthesis
MKILILTSSFPGIEEGILSGYFVYELAKRLMGKGFEIVVLCAHHPKAKLEEDMAGLMIHRFPYFYPFKYQKIYRAGGIAYNLKNSHLAKLQVPLFFLSELLYAIKIIKKEKIDVIHSHWLVPQGLVGAICKQIFKIPHLSTIHAADVFGLERLPFKRKFANLIAKNSDEIIVVSSYISERLLGLISPELKKDIEKKMTILPMGVDAQQFQNTNDKLELLSEYKINSEFNLLFLGRLSEKKGISYLIKAMPQIVSQIKDVNLILCGAGHLRKELEQLLKKMSLEKYVRFTGFVSNEEKIDYLSLADVLIVPSIVIQSGETEGLPVVILEGLAAGKPIIASDVSGVKDVIKNGYNGFLVEQKNSDQIADKVLELLDNRELRAEFSKNALKTAKNYDWEVIGRKYEKIIRGEL